MSREGGLGRGLSSLIPQKSDDNFSQSANSVNQNKNQKAISQKNNPKTKSKTAKETGSSNNELNSITEVEIGQIKTNPFQPRKTFDKEKLGELGGSIKKHGIIQPLVVTKRPEGGFELIAGERRLKAAKEGGLSKVPVIIKKIDDKEKLEWALIENIQRHDLNVIEEAEAYQNLTEQFGYTQEEIAKQVGKSRSAVANILRLLELSGSLKQKVKEGFLSEGAARALLGLEDKHQRESLAEKAIEKQLTVRVIEKRIHKINHPEEKTKAKFAKNPEILNWENRVSQSLGTKVNIKKSEKGGKFILNYYSEEEFNNLLNKLIS